MKAYSKLSGWGRIPFCLIITKKKKKKKKEKETSKGSRWEQSE